MPMSTSTLAHSSQQVSAPRAASSTCPASGIIATCARQKRLLRLQQAPAGTSATTVSRHLSPASTTPSPVLDGACCAWRKVRLTCRHSTPRVRSFFKATLPSAIWASTTRRARPSSPSVILMLRALAATSVSSPWPLQ